MEKVFDRICIRIALSPIFLLMVDKDNIEYYTKVQASFKEEFSKSLFRTVLDGVKIAIKFKFITSNRYFEDNKDESSKKLYGDFIIADFNVDLNNYIQEQKQIISSSLKENDMYKGLKWIFLCVGFYLAILVLNLPENVFSICVKIIRVVVILSIAKILIGMISPESRLMKKVQENDKFQENKSALKVGYKILKVIIYVIAGFLIIADFGYDLNGIITGLGLGSVVIGLAAQELVSNLLSGVAISSEKPFKIGDWVTIGTVSGTVVDIKFRSIKVKTADNTTVTILNTKVLNESIINYATIDSRRFEVILRLPLNTSSYQIEDLMNSLKNFLHSIKEADQDTIQVFIDGIQTDAIVVKTIVYVNIDAAYFLDFKTETNLGIMKILESKGIKLANPSTDVYLNR